MRANIWRPTPIRPRAKNFASTPAARRRLVESDDAREVEALLQNLYDTPRKEAA